MKFPPATVAHDLSLREAAEIMVKNATEILDERMWESLNTFYYRGRFGDAEPVPKSARAPDVGGAVVDRWRTLPGNKWRIGGITGDYNGIHYWRWYARMFGFQHALHHPQLILGQCMARLPVPGAGEGQRLETWLKGPVFHGSDVNLFARAERGTTTFELIPSGVERPAILGRWSIGVGGIRPPDEDEKENACPPSS